MRFLALWLLLVIIAIAVHLGGFPLLDADEGRNAEVGREMAVTNDYVMPRLNGLPYLDKPVVYFAAEAAAMEVLGPTEVAARLPAYLFTIATAFVLLWYARRLWGVDEGYIAAIVFLTIPLTVAFARTVIFDSALAFFVTVALIAFHIALTEHNKRWSILAWASMGVAMITKGPVTFLLVLLVAIPFAWKYSKIRILFPILGIVAFAAIVAPWVWGVSQVVPEFLRYVMVTETVERMATKALKRTGPPWYFLPYFLGGALPWSIIALFSWKKIARKDPAVVYWLMAFLIPFVFFSINQSKRPQYIVPLMAPLALLVAKMWPEAKTRIAAILISVFGVILLLAPLAFHRTKMKPEIAAVADETAIALGVAFLISGVIALFVKRRDFLLAALTVPMLVLPIAAHPLLQAVGERRSTRSFVAELQPHINAQTEIIGVEAFTGSLAFYLRRPIVVVTEDASELTSNYLIRRYDKFTSNPASPLKPLPYFEQSLTNPEPRVYIVRNNDAKRRALLESRGWKVVADQAHLVGYAKN